MGVSFKFFVNWFAQSSKKHYLCSEFPLLVREGIFLSFPVHRVHRCVSYGAAASQPQFRSYAAAQRVLILSVGGRGDLAIRRIIANFAGNPDLQGIRICIALLCEIIIYHG